MKLVNMWVASALLLSCHVAIADLQSPVDAEASSTFSPYSLPDLINQSGISGGLNGGTHGNSFTTMWMADLYDVTPVVTFDLGAVLPVNAAHIWNYNSTIDLERGFNGFDIYSSNNDVSYTLLRSANLDAGTGSNVPAQIVPMGVVARYIRFEATSNHGADDFTGLSEVAFDIGPPIAPVPSLSTWALLLMSLLMGSLAMRRFRKV